MWCKKSTVNQQLVLPAWSCLNCSCTGLGSWLGPCSFPRALLSRTLRFLSFISTHSTRPSRVHRASSFGCQQAALHRSGQCIWALQVGYPPSAISRAAVRPRNHLLVVSRPCLRGLVNLCPRLIMDQVMAIVEPGKQFAKDSIRLLKRCTKPDRKGELNSLPKMSPHC